MESVLPSFWQQSCVSELRCWNAIVSHIFGLQALSNTRRIDPMSHLQRPKRFPRSKRCHTSTLTEIRACKRAHFIAASITAQ